LNGKYVLLKKNNILEAYEFVENITISGKNFFYDTVETETKF